MTMEERPLSHAILKQAQLHRRNSKSGEKFRQRIRDIQQANRSTEKSEANSWWENTLEQMIHSARRTYDLHTLRAVLHAFQTGHFKKTMLQDTDLVIEHSALKSPPFSHIKLNGTEINLLDNKLTLTHKTPWEHNSKLIAGICELCEKYHGQALSSVTEPNADTSISDKGVLFFAEGRPVGYMKLSGEKTFLASRQVAGAHNEIELEKGKVYALHTVFYSSLVSLVEKNSRDGRHSQRGWWRLDLEHLDDLNLPPMQINDLRFVAEPVMYDALSELTKEIEQGAVSPKHLH